MKKYFQKIIALVLLVGVFQMSSGFCAQILLDLVIKANIAQAASIENSYSEIDSYIETDACGEQQPEAPSKEPLETSHDKTMLPCCVDDTHSSDDFVAVQSTEFIKFAQPAIVEFFQFFNIPQAVSYKQAANISPPNRLVIKTTVLRV